MASHEEITAALKDLEFFQDIGPEHLDQLAGQARIVDIAADQEIFHEQDTARDVFVIVSGQVSLIISLPKLGRRKLMDLGAGELIGLSPLVGRSRLWDTAIAASPTRAIAFNGARTLELCRNDPEFGFEFMHRVSRVMARRLGASREQFLEFCGYRLPEIQLESD